MTLVLNKATTVLPVDDAERARHFYADTLGLPHRGVADDGSELFGSEGGPMLQLMPVKDGKHSEHTALSFEVSEIERTVREMEAKGVMFQDYDLPNLKTENHICTTDSEKCAWFMDSEHNILCVHENISAMADYQLYRLASRLSGTPYFLRSSGPLRLLASRARQRPAVTSTRSACRVESLEGHGDDVVRQLCR
jgi:catechol 2,3-dioxygenase-like lactoylglutathione lyase family enzyme